MSSRVGHEQRGEAVSGRVAFVLLPITSLAISIGYE